MAPIYLNFRWNGNYEPDFTEQQWMISNRYLLRHLELMKRHNVRANYLFTPAQTIYLLERHPDVLKKLQESGMHVGHHGAPRPPEPMQVQRVLGMNWEEDVRAAWEHDACAMDLQTSALDRTRTGGLTRMKEILGGDVLSTGRPLEASVLYVTKLMGCRIFAGLSDNLGASRNEAWYLGMLNLPDGFVIHPNWMILPWALRGAEDPRPIAERWLEKVNPQQFNMLTIIIHDMDLFKNMTEEEGEKIWAAYEKVVEWAVAKKNLQPIVIPDILELVIDDREKDVTLAMLDTAAKQIVEAPVDTFFLGKERRLSEFIDLGDDYLSLTDAFQAICLALDQYRSSKTLPESVHAYDILGPTTYGRTSAIPLEVRGEHVLESAHNILPGLRECVPAEVPVEGTSHILNASEFLFCAAQTYSDIRRSGKPGVVAKLRKLDMIPASSASVSLQRELHFKSELGEHAFTPDPLSKLQFWTFKPARFKGHAVGRTSDGVAIASSETLGKAKEFTKRKGWN